MTQPQFDQYLNASVDAESPSINGIYQIQPAMRMNRDTGEWYPITTETVDWTRAVSKPSMNINMPMAGARLRDRMKYRRESDNVEDRRGQYSPDFDFVVGNDDPDKVKRVAYAEPRYSTGKSSGMIRMPNKKWKYAE